MPVSLDTIDKKVLSLLQEQGRLSNAQLAKEVGLSAPSMLERVRKLEKNGVIKKYVALVDPKEVGQGITAFVSVSLRLHQKEEIEAFVEEVRQIPEVLECHHVSGEADYLMKVVSRDIEHYEKFLLGKLTHFKVISRIHTSFILKSLKQETTIPVA
jgi:Lrp/AsnC family transcriptional regulator, leucine-responsive regulatory protein